MKYQHRTNKRCPTNGNLDYVSVYHQNYCNSEFANKLQNQKSDTQLVHSSLFSLGMKFLPSQFLLQVIKIFFLKYEINLALNEIH